MMYIMVVKPLFKRTHPMSGLLTKAELDQQRLIVWLQEVGGGSETKKEIARLQGVVARQKEEILRLRDELRGLRTIK